MEFEVKTAKDMSDVMSEIAQALMSGATLKVSVKSSKQRTLTQNAALHLYCANLADALNDAGYDMKRTLKPDAEIPWTSATAKEHLWKPIQVAVIEKSSTTEANTAEYSKVYEVLSLHLASKFGINVEWPSNEPPMI